VQKMDSNHLLSADETDEQPKCSFLHFIKITIIN
jgi:hypothetical protein